MNSNLSTSIIKQKENTAYSILFSISFAHLINDLLQSVIPAMYPFLQEKYVLTFSQIGLITLTYQLTASVLQPFIGHYTDKNPKPKMLLLCMFCTLIGIILLSLSNSFIMILVAVSCVGIGSSIFHPESSRVAYLSSGNKRGLAQSVFQLGGNAGTAIGPLLVAVIIIPNNQKYTLFFIIASIIGLFVMQKIAKWYQYDISKRASRKINKNTHLQDISKKRITISIIILLTLIFSKYFYMASMTSYYTFYMIDKFHLTTQQSQIYLFLFLGAIATGTVIGGPLGDRFGRKYIIWISILGVAPFTLLLPFANLFWTSILSVCIGVILASAFSAILVFAQELIPGKEGMISGLFFGFAFGIAGIGAAMIGYIADHSSIEFVFKICSFLPLIGIIALFLPNINNKK